MRPLRTNSHASRNSAAGALLRAGLHDPLVLAGRIDHRAAFGDHQRQRLLAIDVLAALAGGDRRQCVPVVGRGDRHRVDVLAVQQLAIVAVDVALPAVAIGHLLLGLGRMVLVDVANGHGPGHAQMALPLSTDADVAGEDLFVGPEDVSGHKVGHGHGRPDGSGGSPQEISSRNSAGLEHGWIVLS